MAATSWNVRSTIGGKVTGGPLSKALRSIGGWLQRWQRRRQERLQLQRLPDYLLRDIGLDRANIEPLLAERPSNGLLSLTEEPVRATIRRARQ